MQDPVLKSSSRSVCIQSLIMISLAFVIKYWYICWSTVEDVTVDALLVLKT